MNNVIRLALACITCTGAAYAQTITLDSFDLGSASGAIVAGSSWENNVTANATSVTIGGTALNDNGWAYYGGALDATGMNYLSFTAALGAGHDTSTLFTIQFEDGNLNTSVLTLDTASFSTGVFATVFVPLVWADGFDLTQISGWTIGGGAPSPGFQDYRLEMEDLSLTIAAIPEPGTYALLIGGVALLATIARRRRQSLRSSSAMPARI